MSNPADVFIGAMAGRGTPGRHPPARGVVARQPTDFPWEWGRKIEPRGTMTAMTVDGAARRAAAKMASSANAGLFSAFAAA